MGFILWLVIGMLAGWLAGKFMGGRGFGVLGNIVVGVIGALLGGFIANNLLGMGEGGFIWSTLIAFLGAILFLGILRLIPGTQPFER